MMFQPHPKKILNTIKNGNFLTWPGLKNQQLLNHLPPNIVTALLHMDQERKILQTKKRVKSEVEVEEDSYFHPDAVTVQAHEMCATITPFNLNIKGFSDLTGVPLHKSIILNLYVMVLYDYDSNAILAKPTKNR